jgi:hypothetical protein
MSESYTFTNGDGAGIVQFTLVYNWQNTRGTGGATTAADFIFNGSKIWSQSDLPCIATLPCWQQVDLDEPIVYGIPFSVQADVSATDEPSAYWQSIGNSLVVSFGDAPITAPEPVYSGLIGVALAFLAWLKRPKPVFVCARGVEATGRPSSSVFAHPR